MAPEPTKWDPAHLETLLHIVETGSFDAAARQLRISPSAVSQRVRAIEASVGQVLVRRSTPCQPTTAGEPLVRLARQVRLLTREAAAQLGSELESDGHRSDRDAIDVAIAIEPVLLSGWFDEVLAAAADWIGTSLRVHAVPADSATDMLRRGEVHAALSTAPHRIQGCSADLLAVVPHVPAAAPGLLMSLDATEGTADGRAWALPLVTVSDGNHLAEQLLAQLNLPLPRVTHALPQALLLDAVRRGLGWAVVPVHTVTSAGEELVVLPHVSSTDAEDDVVVPVEMWWHRWRLDSPALDRLGTTVRAAATQPAAPATSP